MHASLNCIKFYIKALRFTTASRNTKTELHTTLKKRIKN